MLWCHSHLVWLVFEASIPTYACFHSETFLWLSMQEPTAWETTKKFGGGLVFSWSYTSVPGGLFWSHSYGTQKCQEYIWVFWKKRLIKLQSFSRVHLYCIMLIVVRHIAFTIFRITVVCMLYSVIGWDCTLGPCMVMTCGGIPTLTIKTEQCIPPQWRIKLNGVHSSQS